MANEQIKEKHSWTDRLQRSWLAFAFGVLATVLVTSGQAVEGFSKIRNAISPPVDASLQFAKDGDRAAFSREFTRLAFTRMNAMARYNTYAGDPSSYSQAEIDAAWADYSRVFADWKNNLMINILGIEQYYGAEKREQFEGYIQTEFSKIHSCLQGVRKPVNASACTISEARDTKVIEEALDQLNIDLYCFVSGLPKSAGQKCWFEVDAQ